MDGKLSLAALIVIFTSSIRSQLLSPNNWMRLRQEATTEDVWRPNFNKYYNNEEIKTFMDKLHQRYPGKVIFQSIGLSAKNRQNLWVMTLANHNPQVKTPGRPDVKYISTMHGNEPIGTVLLLRLAFELLEADSKSSCQEFLPKDKQWCVYARALMLRTRVHMFPMMNPDGFDRAREGACGGNVGRSNGNRVDLNRNFPDIFHGSPKQIQSENQAVIDWIRNNDFLLSANFHTGALVVNYPYDTNKVGRTIRGEESRTKDDKTFKHISTIYAKSINRNLKMRGCRDGHFPSGVTNGAAWYVIKGGMQDYNYGEGIMEVTIELSCCKYPSAEQLESFWDDNKFGLVKYLLQVHQSYHGMFFDNQGPIANATLRIFDSGSINVTARTNAKGEFWKIIAPGKYNVEQINDSSNENPVQNGTKKFPTIWIPNLFDRNGQLHFSGSYRLKKSCNRTFALLPGRKAWGQIDDTFDLEGRRPTDKILRSNFG